jgi:hypothetical protein
MELYPSILFVEVCSNAPIFPSTIVRTAIIHNVFSITEGNPFFHPISETRIIITIIPAAFGTNAKNAVTADAAPWYTSGAYKCIGAAAIL